MTPSSLLTEEQAAVRGSLRLALADLEIAIESLGASADDRALLSDARGGLDDLFMLVVVGEFNAGKSALVNELLQTALLAEGVTPTTASITLVHYGEVPAEEWRTAGILERRIPADALRDIAIVDTPGTNAIVRQHEQLTREFVPRADLVLFVTSADRPYTETERALLAAIADWGKKVVVVVNKVDLLETESAKRQVLDFVGDSLRGTLGVEPPVFPTSVRLARLAEQSNDPAVRRALEAQSGMANLRLYVFGTLDEEERLRLKLSTPLGVAERLLSRYAQLLEERVELLAEDRALVANIEGQFDVYAEDLRRSFAPRLAEIENVIHELNDRGVQFFEETIRIGRIADLLNAERTRGAFERDVVGDTAERVDRLIDGFVDWFVESEARLWRQVASAVRQRQGAAGQIEADPDFIGARRQVLQAVENRTRSAMSSFDRNQEARQFGQSMRDAVARTALAEIGAVSLGAAIAIVFGTVAADVTGLLAATLAAGLGLYILPARKRRALREFRAKTAELRQRLMEALRSQLDREISGSADRVREAIAPYTRYVRAEAQRLDEQRQVLRRIGDEIARLRGTIGSS